MKNPFTPAPTNDSVTYERNEPILQRLGDRWILCGLLTAQLLVCAPGLFLTPLWLDESYSALIARRSILEIHQSMVFDAGPPLYYDLLHGWWFLFGESETALRSMSLLFALVSTALYYHLCRMVCNRTFAFLAAAFWIFTPLTVHYAVETRNYTLFAALSLGYVYCLLQYGIHHNRWALIVSIPISIALVYTHNIAWFLLLAGAITALFVYPNWRLRLKWFTVSLLTLLFYIPWIPTLLKQLDNTEKTIAWVEKLWSPTALWAVFNVFQPGGNIPIYMDLLTFPSALQLMNHILFGSLLLFAIYQAMRYYDRRMIFIIVLFSLGILGPYFYSLFWKPIYLPGRTDFHLYPFWLLVIAYGVMRIPGKELRIACGAVIVLQMLFLSGFSWSRTDSLNERPVIEYFNRYGKTGEVIVCTGLTRPPLAYYLKERGFIFISYPRDMADHLAHCNEEWYVNNTDLTNEAEAVLKHVLDSTGAGGRFWVVGSDRRINRPLFDLLESKRTLNHARIQTPKMGLRKLNEPLFIDRYEIISIQSNEPPE